MGEILAPYPQVPRPWALIDLVGKDQPITDVHAN